MKKLIVLCVLLLIAATAFSEIEMSAGAQVEYMYNSFFMSQEVDADNFMEMTIADNILGFSGFFDATYVRLAVEYAMSLGSSSSMKTEVGGVGVEDSADSPDGYSMNLLNIILLGKYPISLGAMTIWPTAGIMYSMIISMDADGDGEADDLSDQDLNDIYAVIGCGLDYAITEQIYITLSAIFNWNFTANPIKDWEETAGLTETFTMWSLAIRVGAGFKF